ncbi:hypothetical protein GJU39_19170 [Pedobacter petrophilus]|uniref:Glycosyltransferase family 9 protein n=1 Tax=Pedobacter petrophilus TaxID=1908241 RepID=A0A7K0G5C7_9SPHI|nr:glycosyltransferase family 9 protein [Pedobacter petrophilus]MRX78206.1 hypothetical protein [Pedobacter petrophilus]
MPTFNKEKTDKLSKIDSVFRKIYLKPKNNKIYPLLSDIEVKEIVVLAFLLIGDTIMYIPAFKTIRKNFPNAKITIVCEKVTEIILKDQKLIDNFVIIDCPWIVKTNYSLKNLLKFKSTLRVINGVEYDLAIDFRGDWRNIFYLNFINSKRKASFNFTGGEYMLTDVVKPIDGIDNFTEESLYLLEQLGMNVEINDRVPKLQLSSKSSTYLQSISSEFNSEGKFVIGIHPGSSQEVKKWEECKYAELILRLAKTSNIKFFIFEGPDENETVGKVIADLKDKNVDFLIVKKNLIEYIDILSLCNLVVCNDSGAAHIAGAFGVPTVVIFGNVDPKYIISKEALHIRVISHKLICKPCFQSFCKYGHRDCIKKIQVDEVYNTTMDLIGWKL